MPGALESLPSSLCPFCEEGEGAQVLGRKVWHTRIDGTPNAPSQPRQAAVAFARWPHMVCSCCGSRWVTEAQHDIAMKLAFDATCSPLSSWQDCWDQTGSELAALQARFVEIHALSKEELAAAEPELKALRKQAIALGNERYALVSARRWLPLGSRD